MGMPAIVDRETWQAQIDALRVRVPAMPSAPRLAGPVGVRPVLKRDDLDRAILVVDAVDHAVLTAARAVQAGQVMAERFAGAARIAGQ